MAQKPWIVPIPGTTQMAHMLENTASINVKFSQNELFEFTNELNSISIHIERLPSFVQIMSCVEAPLKK